MSIPHPNCPFPLLPSEDFPLWSWMLKDKKYYLLYSNRHRSEFYDTLICDSMKNWPKGVVDAVRWYKFFFSAQYKLPASKDFFYDSFAPTTYYAALEQYYDVDLSGLPAVLYSRDRQEVYRLKIEKIDREETSYVPRYVSRYVQDLITRPPSWFRLRDLPESPVPPREAAPPSPPQTPLARTAAAVPQQGIPADGRRLLRSVTSDARAAHEAAAAAAARRDRTPDPPSAQRARNSEKKKSQKATARCDPPSSSASASSSSSASAATITASSSSSSTVVPAASSSSSSTVVPAASSASAAQPAPSTEE